MRGFLRLALVMVIAVTLHQNAHSQSVSINTTGAVANNSAILDVSSTAKGVLIPRMDKTQKNAIATPATGLLVYQTVPDSIGFHYFDGIKWIWLSGMSDSTAWKITGNSNIKSSNFLGTTNDSALRFRINNIPSGIVDSITSNTALGYRNFNNITTGTGNTAMGYMSAKSLSTGVNNVSVGRNAMSRTGGSVFNIAIGDSSMSQALSQTNTISIGTNATKNANLGEENIAIGINALANYTSLGGNIGIGRNALMGSNGQGFYTYNVAVGAYSQEASTNNSDLNYLSIYNTSVGTWSLRNNIAGKYNTGIGISALTNNDTSFYNTAVGGDAMYSHRGSNGSNSAFGAFALRGDSIGYWNTAIGSEAMDRIGYDGTANGTGHSNVALGFRALRRLRQGIENTAVGVGALEYDSSGNYNVGVGRYAGFLNTKGDHNISMGYQAGYTADSASATVAIGSFALLLNKADSNVAIGYRAGRSLGGNSSWTPTEATFIGNWAGDGAFVSSKNTAIGFRALAQRNAAGTATDFIAGGRNTAIGDSAMANSAGISNVVIGAQAFPNGGVGVFSNVAIGDSAMGGATLVSENVAIGYHSLKKINSGSTAYPGNTATGAYSGTNLTTGYWNAINGFYALENATTAAGNTVMGTSSFRSNVTAVDNVGVGINTGYFVTSGNNTYLGSYAGVGVTGRSTGASNTGVGDHALNGIRSGSQNVAMGLNALRADSSGGANVAVGSYSLFTNVSGDYNTAVGYSALLLHKVAGAAYNTALGASALEQDTSGFQNTGVGVSAFRNNRTGFYNTGLGINAGYHQKESYNTFVGAHAGTGERSPSTNYAADTGKYNAGLGAYTMFRMAQGSNNVAMGYSALYSDSSGNLNTAVGNGALYSNRGSHENQALGWNALYSYNNTTFGFNNAFGDRAAESLQTGTSNVAMGSYAMLNLVTGSRNTVLGNYAMGIGTTASFNTAVGDNALFNTNADGNTGVGRNAGNTNSSGTNNTLIGYDADVTTTTQTYATAIGAGATVSCSNCLVLGGNSATTRTKVGINNNTPSFYLDLDHPTGIGNGMGIHNTSVASGWELYQSATTNFFFNYNGGNVATINSATGAYVATSDRRLKTNIKPMESILDRIMKLRPSRYQYTRNNPSQIQSIGLIAQDVEPLFPEFVSKQKSDEKNPQFTEVYGLDYAGMSVVAIKAIQEQQKIIEDLKKKNEQLEKDMQIIKTKLGINN